MLFFSSEYYDYTKWYCLNILLKVNAVSYVQNVMSVGENLNIYHQIFTETYDVYLFTVISRLFLNINATFWIEESPHIEIACTLIYVIILFIYDTMFEISVWKNLKNNLTCGLLIWNLKSYKWKCEKDLSKNFCGNKYRRFHKISRGL